MTLKTLLYGCVLWTEFREPNGSTVYDLSTQNNHGTIYGAQRTGFAYGRSLKFDGIDDYVGIPYSPSLEIRQAISIEAWFKPLNLTGRRDIVHYGIYDEAVLFLEGGYLKAQVVTEGGWQPPVTFPEPLKLNVWYHGALVFDKDDTKYYVYLNSVKAEGTKDQTPLRPAYVGKVYIGENGEDWQFYFNGIITTVRVYNRPLTSKEIQTRYQYPKYAPRLVVA